MRIYIIGYMASGKSNLGRALANRLGFDFVDLDFLFEERFRISVLDFFAKYDESAFRRIERTLLHETLERDNLVISTGGGTPCFFDNMDVIEKAGLSVYLKMDAATLVARLGSVRRKRPLLKDIPPSGLPDKVQKQLAAREPFYARASLVVDGAAVSMDDLADRVRSML